MKRSYLKKITVCLIILLASITYITITHKQVYKYGFEQHPYKYYIRYKQYTPPRHHKREVYKFHLTDKNGRDCSLPVAYSTYRSCEEKTNVVFDMAIRELDTDYKLEMLYCFYVFVGLVGIGINFIFIIVFITCYFDEK